MQTDDLPPFAARPCSHVSRLSGERVRNGDWFQDGTHWKQITKESAFVWFIGQPVKKEGFIFLANVVVRDGEPPASHSPAPHC